MLACNRYRMDGLLPFSCMCHPSFLIYIQIISFSFVISLMPIISFLSFLLLFINLMSIISFHSVLFSSSISCPLSLSIPFKVFHFLLFINLMSVISFHSIQSTSFSFVYQSLVHYLFPFHSKYLIFFCSSIPCPLSLVHLFHANDLIQFY